MNDLKTVVRYFEMRWEGKTDFEALAMCDRRDMERTAMAALRGVLERQEGCWHCRGIEAHEIESITELKDAHTNRIEAPADIPYRYCGSCGRALNEPNRNPEQVKEGGE